MSIFRRKKDWTEKVAELRSTAPYDEYDEITNEVITQTRRMAHCDQWVLHAPTECEFCDDYPELQLARERLGINFTGHDEPGKLRCPAERLRSITKIERWAGNVKETAERKAERTRYYEELNALLRKEGLL